LWAQRKISPQGALTTASDKGVQREMHTYSAARNTLRPAGEQGSGDPCAYRCVESINQNTDREANGFLSVKA
jgi:hypothetical protein